AEGGLGVFHVTGVQTCALPIYSDFAPSFSIKVIDVYQQGDFPTLVLPANQDFIQRYGISSNYWTERKGAIGDNALAYLHQSLQRSEERRVGNEGSIQMYR